MAEASASISASSDLQVPSQYRIVGVVLAVASGLLIGSSFVFKKKGLIQSQAGAQAGVGVGYLKNTLWWFGMSLMIVGEICNFAAYAFTEAIIVTPLGALSVVICAILSSFFLNEKLSFFGWIGCLQCIIGSVIIALNGPREQSVSTIVEFKKLFLAPSFLAFGSVIIVASLIIIFFIAPRYGQTNMLWYILVCSLIGGLSVSCTQGLGASIVTSIRGHNQFKNWFIYFLLAFVVVTLLTEIYFLNVALALFNTAMVTPTYYVIFTFCTLATSVILYQGLNSSAIQILTVVLGFLVICSGITLLQMSKVDPTKLQKLDRKSTILLQAAKEEVTMDHDDPNKEVEMTEEPGMDALRGTFGVAGTIARAKRRNTITQAEGLDAEGSPFGRVRSRRGTTSSSINGFNGVLSHDLEKSATTPQTTEKVPPVPSMPTHFWHRRTGSGPRKQRLRPASSTPSMTTNGVSTRSNRGLSPGRPSRDARSLSMDTPSVQEQDEPESNRNTDHGKELSIATLLAKQDGPLHPKSGEPSSPTRTNIPTITFAPRTDSMVKDDHETTIMGSPRTIPDMPEEEDRVSPASRPHTPVVASYFGVESLDTDRGTMTSEAQLLSTAHKDTRASFLGSPAGSFTIESPSEVSDLHPPSPAPR